MAAGQPPPKDFSLKKENLVLYTYCLQLRVIYWITTRRKNTTRDEVEDGRVQIIRSSLPYQVLLYLNGWYFGFFFLCEILIFAFKGETLPYAENVLPAEVILVFLLAGIEALRLFFAQKGNLTERIVGVLVSIVLSIPAVVGALYLILWQTYVLRIDVILAAIQVALIGLELVFGIVSMITFARATPY